jgi:SMI1 / KNR4 family (SUKH-1)
MSNADHSGVLEEIEAWLGQPLPAAYAQFLLTHEEAMFGERVLLYAADSVIERNETFETRGYCPGYLAIGDDSGGRALVISLTEASEPVYSVDHGDMTPRGLKQVTHHFAQWLHADCPLE